MRKICGQADKPEVDESQLECDEFVSSVCVYLKGTNVRVDDKPYPNLNDYILFKDKELYDLRRSNTLLTKELNLVKSEMRRLLSDIKKLNIRVDNIKVRGNGLQDC